MAGCKPRRQLRGQPAWLTSSHVGKVGGSCGCPCVRLIWQEDALPCLPRGPTHDHGAPYASSSHKQRTHRCMHAHTYAHMLTRLHVRAPAHTHTRKRTRQHMQELAACAHLVGHAVWQRAEEAQAVRQGGRALRGCEGRQASAAIPTALLLLLPFHSLPCLKSQLPTPRTHTRMLARTLGRIR